MLVVALASACAQDRGPPPRNPTAEQACITAAACDRGARFLPECIDEVSGDGVACLAAAGSDCTAARACDHTTYAVGSCTPGTDVCEGDTVVGCVALSTSTVTVRLDCTATGQRCMTTRSGFARCTFGPCTSDICVTPTHARTCYDGVYDQDTECGEETSCQLLSGGAARCVAIGAPCMGHSTCDGERRHFCDLAPDGWHFAGHTDCAPRGAHCMMTASGDAFCVENGTECAQAESVPSCDGDAVHYCGSDGLWHWYDCRAHGFRGCTLEPGRAPYCIPSGLDLHG